MLSFLGRKTIYEEEIQNEEENEMEIGKNEILNTNSGVLIPEEMKAYVGGQVLLASAEKISVETVNDLMKKVTSQEFLTTSPCDGGTYIGVIRTDDVMKILCDYFEVDGKKTDFGAYYTVK